MDRNQVKELGMYIMESAPGARVVINGREMDYFCGCGYFGLQAHPELAEAACRAVREYGVGGATSRQVYGNNPVLLKVEENAARFFKTESALHFISGYLGNAILLQGLREEYEVIFMDRESHFSVVDGASCAQKPIVEFDHLDPGDLRRKIRETLRASGRPLLICDGVFPVSGEISPLPDYLDVLKEWSGYTLCVDDAHAVGVLGENGRGTFEHFGLAGDRLYFSGTLSKAFGGMGGIIPGKKDLIERLRNKSGIPYASSPPSNPAAAASARALELLAENPGWRRRLWDNVRYAKDGLRELGFAIPDTPVPIICLHSGKDVDLKTLQVELFEKGIAVLHVGEGGYSSVPPGGAVRIAVFSTHTRDQIDRLVEEIGAFLRRKT